MKTGYKENSLAHATSAGKQGSNAVPTTYTALGKHLYELVTAEGQRRNPADVPKPWDDLSRSTRLLWVQDARLAWIRGGPVHPQQWARDMMTAEVKRLKALL